MNRVGLAMVALTGAVPKEAERAQFEWHLNKHMPELMGAPGVLHGQRWCSTPACRELRVVESEELHAAESVIVYLFAHPAAATWAGVLDYSRGLPADTSRPPGGEVLLDALFSPVSSAAALRTAVAGDVLPWRPHRGIWLVVDELPSDPMAAEEYLCAHEPLVRDLVEVPGVAGIWLLATDSGYPPMPLSRLSGTYRVSVVFLDHDLTTAASQSRPVLQDWAEAGPAATRLAAPFESVLQWEWARFLRTT